jgi:CheY-like chemotaxis protein
MFLAPFRCRVCRMRFYRVWRPSLQRPPAPPIAPLFMMPARHKLLNLDPIEPRRIEPEPVRPPGNTPQLVPFPPLEVEMTETGATEAVVVKRTLTEADLPEAKPSEARALPPAPLLASRLGVILILESDLSIRKLLRRLLERRGYVTVEISEAGDLPAELRDRHADLLIMDVSTGGGARVEAAVALARTHPALKILALSAESLEDHEIPGRLLALPKPFPLESFVDCVDHLLEPPKPINNSVRARVRRFDHS